MVKKSLRLSVVRKTLSVYIPAIPMKGCNRKGPVRTPSSGMTGRNVPGNSGYIPVQGKVGVPYNEPMRLRLANCENHIYPIPPVTGRAGRGMVWHMPYPEIQSAMTVARIQATSRARSEKSVMCCVTL